MTTQTKQIVLYVISLVLMVATIHLGYWISYTFAHWFFWILGCLAFGIVWDEITYWFIKNA